MRTGFKKRFEGKVLSFDEKVRQGQVVRSAQIALTTTDNVRAFLNTDQKQLGGRPIDVAIESAGGLARVEQFLAGQAEIMAASLKKPTSQPVHLQAPPPIAP
jgi:hypothetical protein